MTRIIRMAVVFIDCMTNFDQRPLKAPRANTRSCSPFQRSRRTDNTGDLDALRKKQKAVHATTQHRDPKAELRAASRWSGL